MEKEVRDITVEEILDLVNSREGEFIIHVEQEKGDGEGYGDGKPVQA